MLQLSETFGEAKVTDAYLVAMLSGQRLTASLVVDEIGSTKDKNGGSRLLGGDADLQWLRALRSRVDLVVTGGATYRTEQYRMPKRADLAVFSRGPLLAPEGFESSPRFLPLVGEHRSLSGELAKLMNRYSNIHLEFGALTLIPILRELGFGVWVSSQFNTGIDTFCSDHDMRCVHVIQLEDLHIAYCL
ncbi:MAG: hypothetical protein RIS08_672 [Actinomycetota bacterium]